eukprot:NODE_1758_length_2380_cov_10.715047.p1 GENE.NODE_1758_length_2380_cov_10.715047~~NODE_1758_length_2380_cov_10.715047.p1  ORF type:complete len:651 (-),score=68.66 NODE_1758_length_2380_cov_10.715047:426-2378(-)
MGLSGMMARPRRARAESADDSPPEKRRRAAGEANANSEGVAPTALRRGSHIRDERRPSLAKGSVARGGRRSCSGTSNAADTAATLVFAPTASVPPNGDGAFAGEGRAKAAATMEGDDASAYRGDGSCRNNGENGAGTAGAPKPPKLVCKHRRRWGKLRPRSRKLYAGVCGAAWDVAPAPPKLVRRLIQTVSGSRVVVSYPRPQDRQFTISLECAGGKVRARKVAARLLTKLHEGVPRDDVLELKRKLLSGMMAQPRRAKAESADESSPEKRRRAVGEANANSEGVAPMALRRGGHIRDERRPSLAKESVARGGRHSCSGTIEDLRSLVWSVQAHRLVQVSYPRRSCRMVTIAWSRAGGESHALRIGRQILAHARRGCTNLEDLREFKEKILAPLPRSPSAQPRREKMRPGAEQAAVRADEILAEAEASGRRLCDADILEVLRLWDFPKNLGRVNVMREGQSFVESEMLGIVRTRAFCRCVVAASTRCFPGVTRLFCKYIRDNKPAGLRDDEDFPFTTICINRGYNAARHRDKNNVGISVVKAVGNFTGGQLLYWTADPGPRLLPDAELHKLEVADAKVLDVGNAFQLVDGRMAHEVTPFEGERYSLVYFSVTSRHLMMRADRVGLKDRYGLEYPEEGVCEEFGLRLNGRR